MQNEALPVTVGLVALWIAAAWLPIGAQPAQSDPPLLRCFAPAGVVVVASPVPTPEDFRVRIANGVTHANWTGPDGRPLVLATTLPCVYVFSGEVPGTAPAQDGSQ